jgi:hypothetical protein
VSGLSLICKDHPRNTQPDPAKDTCYFCGLPLPARAPASIEILESTFDEKTRTTGRRIRVKRKRGDVIFFTISQDVILGTADEFELVEQPYVTFIPRRLYANAVAPSMFLTNSALLSNVNQIASRGWLDCYIAHSRAGLLLTKNIVISPANRIRFHIKYNGYCPPSLIRGMPFTFCLAFRGPTVDGGYPP